jgi:hypothetical protein
MKPYVFFWMLFISTAVMGQEQNDSANIAIIPKDATTIYVRGIKFNLIESELIREGFKIEFKVANTIVVTKYKTLQGTINWVKFRIRYNNGTAQIMGTLHDSYGSLSRSRQVEDVITYDRYPTKKAFLAMNDFALALRGEISYE